jgi:hypothetical protein
MDSFARTILGYHGCEPEFANALISGEVPINQWKPSENDYDWLGKGIYFWEHAPQRAKDWSKGGAVVGAVIQITLCLDLVELEYANLLADEFESLRIAFEAEGERLPVNRAKRRDLDNLVINRLVKTANEANIHFQAVRSPFLEGEPAFEGSKILRESHIQLAVLDPACIVGVFRPNLD